MSPADRARLAAADAQLAGWIAVLTEHLPLDVGEVRGKPDGTVTVVLRGGGLEFDVVAARPGPGAPAGYLGATYSLAAKPLTCGDLADGEHDPATWARIARDLRALLAGLPPA